MLDLTNEETQRQLSPSVTEGKDFFAEFEAGWDIGSPI